MPMNERNHEVRTRQNLLDAKGCIIEEGWARHPVWSYDRKAVKANPFRIKEWDYYAITNQSKGWTVCGTISDLGYASLLSVSFVDIKKGGFSQRDEMKYLTLGRMGLSPSSTEDGSCQYIGRHIRLSFIKKGAVRRIMIAAPDMKLPDGSVGLDANLELSQPTELESMNIATSWKENRKAFYLNEKVNCMAVSGTVRTGNETQVLAKDEAWAVLDWGRGRWTYQNTWYWGSGSGVVDGHSFGFNIGYGFTDRTPASENAVFYDGKVHKLDDVRFIIPESGFMDDWRFESSDGRFEMVFKPSVDRSAVMNLGVIKTVQHQVFGYFTGTAVLDDGTPIRIKDFPAFAEKVFNRY